VTLQLPHPRPPPLQLEPNPTKVHPAPGPEEVNWQHLWLNWRQRDLRTVLTWPLMLLVVIFPITGVTSAVARLQYVLCPAGTIAAKGASAAAAQRFAGRVRFGAALVLGGEGKRCGGGWGVQCAYALFRFA